MCRVPTGQCIPARGVTPEKRWCIGLRSEGTPHIPGVMGQPGCGVPSERVRNACMASCRIPGFHPGLACVAPLGPESHALLGLSHANSLCRNPSPTSSSTWSGAPRTATRGSSLVFVIEPTRFLPERYDNVIARRIESAVSRIMFISQCGYREHCAWRTS